METDGCRLTLKYHTEPWECAGAESYMYETLDAQIKYQMCGAASCG